MIEGLALHLPGISAFGWQTSGDGISDGALSERRQRACEHGQAWQTVQESG